MIRIVMLGDIVGTPGRHAAIQALPKIRQNWQPDLILANSENVANGSGLTPKDHRRLIDAGFDGLTLGDHVFRKKQITNTLEHESNVIRPANLSHKAAGKGMMRFEIAADDQGQHRVAVYVMTVLTRLFMASMPASDPFACADGLIAQARRRDPGCIILVEAHGETTSEKQALGWYLSGRVSAVLGTHTHVPTADSRILPAHVEGSGGESGPPPLPSTAYISDLGMTGPTDSVLGRRVDRVVKNMTTNMPAPFDVAEGSPVASGVVIGIDPSSGRATDIEHFTLPAEINRPPFVAA